MSGVSVAQVLALVFIRKLMDCIFTKRELSWLDDLMPESKKKKLEDTDEVLLKERFMSILHHLVSICMYFNELFFFNLQEEEQSIVAEDDGIVQVPLEGYK